MVVLVYSKPRLMKKLRNGLPALMLYCSIRASMEVRYSEIIGTWKLMFQCSQIHTRVDLSVYCICTVHVERAFTIESALHGVCVLLQVNSFCFHSVKSCNNAMSLTNRITIIICVCTLLVLVACWSCTVSMLL